MLGLQMALSLSLAQILLSLKVVMLGLRLVTLRLGVGLSLTMRLGLGRWVKLDHIFPTWTSVGADPTSLADLLSGLWRTGGMKEVRRGNNRVRQHI